MYYKLDFRYWDWVPVAADKKAHERLIRRGATYSYARRVPKRFAHLDSRNVVRIALGTGNLIEAKLAADAAERSLETLWTSLASEDDGDAWVYSGARLNRVITWFEVIAREKSPSEARDIFPNAPFIAAIGTAQKGA